MKRPAAGAATKRPAAGAARAWETGAASLAGTLRLRFALAVLAALMWL